MPITQACWWLHVPFSRSSLGKAKETAWKPCHHLLVNRMGVTSVWSPGVEQYYETGKCQAALG